MKKEILEKLALIYVFKNLEPKRSPFDELTLYKRAMDELQKLSNDWRWED